MKNFLKLNSLIAAVAMLTTASAAYASPTASFAVSGGGSHVVGTPFTVVISENSGAQEVNAVDAKLHYDAAVLQVTGLSVGDFSTCPVAPSASGGTISFQCAALGSKLVGSHVVGTITFRPLTSGVTTVNVLSNSAIVDANTIDQNDWNGVTSSATYTLTAPAQPSQGNGAATPTPRPAASAPAKSVAPSASPAVAGASATVSPTPSNSPAAVAQTNTSDSKTAASSKSNTGLLMAAAALLLLLIGGGLYWAKRYRKPAVKA